MTVRTFIKKVTRRIFSKIEDQENKEAVSKYIKVGEGSFFLSSPRLDFRLRPENRTYVDIGKKCLLRIDFIFETTTGFVSIGNNVQIGGGATLCRTRIEIHDDVTIAWGLTLYDHNSHSIHWEERKNDNAQCYKDHLEHNGNAIVNKDWSNVVSKPIIIESKVWIGFNVTILKGVRIGEGAVVGACSVVTKNVEPWTVVAGNPAVVVKRIK